MLTNTALAWYKENGVSKSENDFVANIFCFLHAKCEDRWRRNKVIANRTYKRSVGLFEAQCIHILLSCYTFVSCCSWKSWLWRTAVTCIFLCWLVYEQCKSTLSVGLNFSAFFAAWYVVGRRHNMTEWYTVADEMVTCVAVETLCWTVQWRTCRSAACGKEIISSVCLCQASLITLTSPVAVCLVSSRFDIPVMFSCIAITCEMLFCSSFLKAWFRKVKQLKHVYVREQSWFWKNVYGQTQTCLRCVWRTTPLKQLACTCGMHVQAAIYM